MHIRWRGLELPSVVECDTATLSSTYGKFIAEPFERGFGNTIGNSLRRILLSSLEGSAVTQIKIRGAQHEFTSIPGVVEDVTDMVLNVKALVVKNHSDSTRVITVERNTAGEIKGGDIPFAFLDMNRPNFAAFRLVGQIHKKDFVKATLPQEFRRQLAHFIAGRHDKDLALLLLHPGQECGQHPRRRAAITAPR